nr:hypothetical protein [uncultured Pedobacter sp.]
MKDPLSIIKVRNTNGLEFLQAVIEVAESIFSVYRTKSYLKR